MSTSPYSRKGMSRILVLVVALAAAVYVPERGGTFRASAQGSPLPPTSFKNFEGPHVHPLAMTPDGSRLLAVNTPNATLSVFRLTGGTPTLTAEIPVGLEPVSVAARNDREAWVVNWLSDSVSIVNLTTGNVTRTIDVGDEPTDVLFTGPDRERAFVCVSGGGRAPNGITGGSGIVKIFDPNDLSASPQTLEIPGKQPRSLARNASGSEVYVSIFESGNQTTVVPGPSVLAGGGPPPPSPSLREGLPAAPTASLIVSWNGAAWVDEANKSWSGFIPYTLADIDLAVLSTAGDRAVVSAEVRGLGTHVGNIAFDPAANRLLIAHMDSANATRFEPKLSGRFQSNRVSLLNVKPGGGAPTRATTRDLNSHVNFADPDGSDAERAQSLAMPADIARASDGTVYVAATGSARVGVLSSSGAVQGRVSVGQGPTGLAVDDARQRLYVLNRFEQTLSVVDTSAKQQISRVSIGFNPEPKAVRDGRRFLYDASLSAHGTVSCASCHQNGHRDGLAWDLGDPQGSMDQAQGVSFHPMKGPMVTQSLRGMEGTGPLHWRGDRADVSSFNPAFVSLLGGKRQLTAREMEEFDAFARSLAYPPNPNEPLDRSLTPQAASGNNAFQNEKLDGNIKTCAECHTTANFGSGTNGVVFPDADLGILAQPLKVPQLRGLYQRTGMDKSPGEKRQTGFGFLHDGAFDTLLNFLSDSAFIFDANHETADASRRNVEHFVLTLDTGTAPAVGLQVTANAQNKSSAEVANRVGLLMQQAEAGNCDLVVRGLFGGVPRGLLFAGAGQFRPDNISEPNVTLQQLLSSVASGAELTFTGVPPGRGRQMALLGGELQSFVRQHYFDFLSRGPDAEGLQFWVNEIGQCGDDAQCRELKRINVSAAFFLSIEFQETGYLVQRMYKAAFGDAAGQARIDGVPVQIAVPAVRLEEFLPDTQSISQNVRVGIGNWAAQLESNKNTFAQVFVARPRFTTAFPAGTTPAGFVERLNTNAGGVLSAAERAGLVAELTADNTAAGRASVLRKVAEDSDLAAAEKNKAFVLMQYFGYLRRNPNSLPDADHSGYNFWLTKLNQFDGNFVQAQMVFAFLDSIEYKQRFAQ